MKLIRQVWTNLSSSRAKKYSSKDIRTATTYKVKNFEGLVKLVAQLSYLNPEWSLFFRGQTADYKNKNELTSLYPSIYRSKEGLLIREKSLIKKYEKLRNSEIELLNIFKKNIQVDYEKVKKYREVRWAILQHYQISDTPLMDLTNSLRVACSFALNNAIDYGYLFVLGLPHPYGSISYFVEEELFIVKLSSICPPTAIRPYYQEGYLAGTFPIDESDRTYKLDMARRLIAKYRLNKKDFWSEDFHAIPDTALLPQNDNMKKLWGNGTSLNK
jgi:hypothetical protein